MDTELEIGQRVRVVKPLVYEHEAWPYGQIGTITKKSQLERPSEPSGLIYRVELDNGQVWGLWPAEVEHYSEIDNEKEEQE